MSPKDDIEDIKSQRDVSHVEHSAEDYTYNVNAK